jgi:hypothetical protein
MTATASDHDRGLDQKDRDTYTHVVAELAMRVPGRTLDARMASVLAYMADRAHGAKHAHPLGHAERRSTPGGPVVAMVEDMVDGRIVHDAWDDVLTVEDGRLTLMHHVVQDDLDQLSVAMTGSIAETAARFGMMTREGFLAWARMPGNLPEWNPEGGDIPLEAMLEAAGHDRATAADATDHEHEMRGVSLTFEEMRLGVAVGTLPRPARKQETLA